MTMNLYGGGQKIEIMMIAQETQGFLGRFRPLVG
jgi:hypothetical protein